MKAKIPISAAKEFAEKWGLNQVLIIAKSKNPNIDHTLSYGKTPEDSGMAAMAIQQLRAVIKAQSTSLKEALEVANKIRSDDVQGFEKEKPNVL